MNHLSTTILTLAGAASLIADPVGPTFNRAPLAEKPYAALPLGSIKAEGWLEDELKRMAAGMTGHLDEWYPEVCGDRNAWLGGDGDTWERGPYWIDGLYPLAHLLGDEELEAKAMQWINWTIENQREDGYIGPVELAEKDRTQPPPRGAQIHKPDDWWPRMVMLKILQQHYTATGDERALNCLLKYFRYQLATLPDAPLHDPDNPRSGSWWAAQRGGDNLMVVLWLYNVTGEKFLLELADIVHEQTIPVTDWFSPGPQNMVRHMADQKDFLHCVNLAQMMKTPIVRWQQDQDHRHLDATENAWADIRAIHGQPHGLYGGDEGMHGHAPSRGSELCSAVEMMFSLETMFEITGNPTHGDRLERIAFNALPTQCTDDHRARQYYQQTNQVNVTLGDRDFWNDGGDRLVYGLLHGYPCCTCNLHQGWPKFAQSLWYSTKGGGLAVAAYAPSSVTTTVTGGQEVTLTQSGGYPFKETVTISVKTGRDIPFPLHLRIPGWARNTSLKVNGNELAAPEAGTMHVIQRTWKNGDTVSLRFPMPLRQSRWYHRSVAIERGPLVYALDVSSEETEVEQPCPDGCPEDAMHRGHIEYRPTSAWNIGLPESVLRQLNRSISVKVAKDIPDNPWTSASAPVRLSTTGIQIPEWKMDRHSASDPPLSPVEASRDVAPEKIELIPYGATTLRIAAFPSVRGGGQVARSADATITASHVFDGDTLDRIMDGEAVNQPRHTFWPRTGTREWVQFTFDNPRALTEASVHWFDDSGLGQCRPPKSWRLLYRKGSQWLPVETSDSYGTAKGKANTVTFKPITTPALRLNIQLQDNFCAGVLEWEVR